MVLCPYSSFYTLTYVIQREMVIGTIYAIVINPAGQTHFARTVYSV